MLKTCSLQPYAFYCLHLLCSYAFADRAPHANHCQAVCMTSRFFAPCGGAHTTAPALATLKAQKHSLGLEDVHLELIRNTVCSQELVLSNDHLDLNKEPWKLVFLVWTTTQVKQYFHYQIFKESFWPELWPGWKITTTKATSLVILKTAAQSETLWALPDHSSCDQWPPSAWDISQSQWNLEFALCRGSLNDDDGSWAPTPAPRGSTLCLLRRCKGIWNYYFTELKGNFSQVPCTDSVYACKCEYAIANY